MPHARKPRIIIYGTGQYGGLAARMAIEKGWHIVAAYNRAGPKVGQDYGRLLGLGRDLGVIVEDCERADFKAVEADVAIVAMTDRLDQEIVAFRRLLGAGINVISHAGEALTPGVVNPEIGREIDELAKKHHVSFLGTGIWDMSRVWSGILVAGPCTEIRSLYHKSITDADRVGKHLMKGCGAGMSQEEFHDKVVKNAGKVGVMYPPIPALVLSKLGYTVTRISERREPVLFDEPYYAKLLEQVLEPGTVTGTRIIARVETKEGVWAEAHIELRLFKEGEVEHMVWQVDGKPGAKITVERDDSAYMSASCMFNRIRDVIAATPGIHTVADLGPLTPSALEQMGAG